MIAIDGMIREPARPALITRFRPMANLEKPLPGNDDNAITIHELLEHPVLRPSAIRLVCAVSKLMKVQKASGPPFTKYEAELYREIRRIFFDLDPEEKDSAFSLPAEITADIFDDL